MNYSAVANLTHGQFIARVWPAWGMVSGTKMGWGVPEGGYRKFEADWLNPALAKGWTRAFIHRPFGDDSAATGEPMNQDAWVERTVPSARDFDDMCRSHPECVFMAYLGSWADPDFGRQLSRGNYSAWLRRVLDSLGNLLDLGNVDIGYDHSVTMRPGYTPPGFPDWGWLVSWDWLKMVNRIKKMQGARVWLESVPSRANSEQHSFPFICSTFTHPQREGGQVEWTRSRPYDDMNYPPQSGNEAVAPSQCLTGQAMDYNRILGREPLAVYAAAIADVLARGPQWHWAGAVFYLPETSEQVWKAVVEYAAARSERKDDDGQ